MKPLVSRPDSATPSREVSPKRLVLGAKGFLVTSRQGREGRELEEYREFDVLSRYLTTAREDVGFSSCGPFSAANQGTRQMNGWPKEVGAGS
jgi:hypothetical protein